MDKINKLLIIMFAIVIILISVLAANIINKKNDSENPKEEVQTQISEVILDECTDEYEAMDEEAISTNTEEEEKISPNCKLTLVKYYKGCKDEINEYLNVPEDIVNCTKEELQKQYKDWEIREFSSTQIVLYKEIEGECSEHYILKDDNGKIIIYKITENGSEEEYEKTEIATDYLPEKDKKSIKEGLKVNGKEKLNELIESFE